MRHFVSLAFVLTLLLAGSASAQKDVPASGPPLRIGAMAWMKGYWVGEGFEGSVETLMGPPKAGAMLGYFRHVKKDGKPGFYEICAIEEFEGSLRFVIKHFHPNWIGWEEKDHALQAKLVRHSADEWVFGNMTVRRGGKDAMVMELGIRGQDGVARKEVLRFKRQPL
jgi:hypothetical protein